MVVILRRLLLALFLVFSTDINKQVFFIQYSSIAFLSYLILVKPLTNRKHELVWVINEALTYLGTLYCYVFSDYMNDVDAKWLLGYFFIASILINISLNAIVLTKYAIQTLRDYFRPKH